MLIPFPSNRFMSWVYCISRSRDSSDGIVTGPTSGVRVPAGERLSILHSAQTGSRAHPTCYPMDAGGHFPGGVVKHPVSEADCSPPSRVEVKIGGVIPPHPICLNGVVLNQLGAGTTFLYKGGIGSCFVIGSDERGFWQ
jgi:hypothetical protein